VAYLNSLRNFDRVKCPGMSEIVKLHSCGQRMGAVDSSGNLSIYNFDAGFHNNCVYSLKKANIINFCYLNPSVIAMVSNSALHVIDTLIHPSRQLKFKQTFTKEPISVSTAKDNRIVVLRKN
jgi:phosphoribulokinase